MVSAHCPENINIKRKDIEMKETDWTEKKGWRGIVRKARLDGKIVCVKSLRGKIEGTSLEREWKALKKANEKGVGPEAIKYSKEKELLVMGLAKGQEFREWIKEAGEEEIREKIPEILRQGRVLDEMGLDHGELSTAPKHIIIGEKVTLIDFGKASEERKCKNLSSLIGYLMLNPESGHAKKIRDALGIGEKETEEIRRLLREDKRGEKEYEKIVRIICQRNTGKTLSLRR